MAKETKTVSVETQQAMADAIEYVLVQVTERPELSWLMLGTEALRRLVNAHALYKGETPKDVMKLVHDGVAATRKRTQIKKIEIGYIYEDEEED